jgi:3-methyladenine DNA glycosylase/8-oxoguanine DNA glycosylase
MLIRAISGKTLTPILRSHGWTCLAPCEVTDDGFRYPVLIGPRTAVTVEITGLNASLRIQADRNLSPHQEDQVKRTVRHMLSVDFPIDDFIAMCRAKKAPALARLARQGWGRMFRSPTLWEDAVKTLCTTNASWGYTQKMCANLCTVLGRSTRGGLKAMAMPQDILVAGDRVLVDEVGMGYRSKSLLALAERALAGDVPWLFDATRTPDAETAEREVRSWHGFGKYATRHQLVLMGFHSYLPIDREVGNHLGIRKPGDKGSDLDSAHFDDWGKFRFTAYKLTRVAKRMNWIGD